ncbi:MAG: 3-methyl-2-oxobutanoate hydroxymethyltransferase [Acidobacteria bacterium]|nr:3-methyl-2-oxobutanoate hydroxymethyltransferase [Acidobacteriota bacterium]
MSVKPEGVEPAGGNRPKTTVLTLAEKKRRGEFITMLTAYDYPTARVVDEAGIDAILVGDSLAMVVLGHPNTLSVTMDEMLHHARAVSRGARRALLVGDMPFMSYQSDAAEAVRNAGRFLQAGMEAVKLEGGRAFAETARGIVRAGIPVQGHIGLTPQSVNALGGWRVQGRSAAAAKALVEDALGLEDAGCFSLVLESVPERLAAYITERLSIPTIGIGAGAGTSGQVLVIHDLLGLYDRFTPKFAKRYAELGAAMTEAVRAYRTEVEAGTFPTRDHSYAMPDEEWQAFLQTAGGRLPKRLPGRR